MAKNSDNPSARLARWIIRLDCYDFKIEYRKGTANGNADALSRWPLKDKDEEGGNDHEDLVINNIYTTILDSQDQQIRINAVKKNEDNKEVLLVRINYICFKV